MMEFSFSFLNCFSLCLLSLAVVNSTPSFLQNRSLPGREWKMVGYLDMTDPTQQCPDSWQKITSPRSSCGKKSTAPCDSLNIATSGASYQTVCGRFRGYQIGSDDAFFYYSFPNIETHYVDGVSVTYGSPGSRHHVYTYAAGVYETNSASSCPCAGGTNPSSFVGSDYYCESGNPGPNLISTLMYSSDVLWDRQQCGGDETMCCNPPDLPWFCKMFPNPISEDLEVRICTDQGFNDESMAIESFELYIQVPSIPPSNVVAITIAPTSVNVSWDQLPSVSGNSYIAHEVRYSWLMGNGQLGTMYVNTSGDSNQLVLNSLQECVQYNISVRAYTSQGPGLFSGSVLDSSLNMYAQVPQPPEVQTSALMATSANLTWSCPLEKIYTVISYSVNVTANDPSSISSNCVRGLNLSYYTTVPGSQRYIQLKDMSLVPFTLYSFEVLVQTNIGKGAVSMPRLFTTLQAPPTPPLSISASVLSYSSLLVSWRPPACSNGIILGYRVTYTPSSGIPSSPYNISNVTALLLRNLLKNTEYSIFLCAFTAVGCSLNITTNATTPPEPTKYPTVWYFRVSTATYIENHQNDAILSQFQDEVYNAVNSSNHIPQTEKSYLEIACTSVPMCRRGTYRIECKISSYLTFISFQILLPLKIMNISRTSLIPLMDTQNISAHGFCSCDLSVNSDHGVYDWLEGVPGQLASQMCQYGIIGQYITRHCDENLTWREDVSKCPTVITDQINKLNAAIKNQTLTTNNIVNISAQLQTVVSRATQMVDQSASNLAVVTTVITQISNVTLSSPDVPISNKTVINIVSVLGNIQNWPPMVLNTSGSLIVRLLEEIATQFVQQVNFTNLDFTQDGARIVAERIPLHPLLNFGKRFNTEASDPISENSSSVPTVSVELPPSLFGLLPSILTDVGIFFTVYKSASLFPIVDSTGSAEVSPLVIGITVATGQQIRNLTDPIVLNFSMPNNIHNYTCVSWDFKASGMGNWKPDGCDTKQVNGSKNTSIQIQCRCNHLTNFAVLVDISERIYQYSKSNPPPEIDIISKIGISLSLFGLVTTVITLLCIKTIRQKDVSKYHIQLCCALIGMLLVFVIGIDRTEYFGGCVTVSVLIHYFTLAAVMWMGAEALLMFQKLVLVFFQTTARYIVVLSIICWVTPLIPVAIPLAIDRNLLVKRKGMDNSTSGYCFINNTTAFFAAFLGPILLILLFNIIIFVLVIVTLVWHQWRRSKEYNRKFDAVKLLINIASIVFLFGLTWIFGALTVVNANKAFQIVFALSNSFQGFLIFIFFCVLNNDVRLVCIHKLLGKQLTSKPRTTNTQMQNDQHRIDQSESVFIKDVPSLGSTLKVTHTISQNECHMYDEVDLRFNGEGRYVESELSVSSFITKRTEDLPGSAAQLVSTFARHKRNTEDNERDNGCADNSNNCVAVLNNSCRST